MAAYLHRIATGMPAARCIYQPFRDVTTSSTFCGVITWMQNSGITYGVGDSMYGTTALVTRQAMASFLRRVSDVIKGAVLPAAPAASAVLAALVVKGKAPMTGYDRVARFGVAWTDDNDAPGGHNSCRTRDDILARDLTHVVRRDDCTVTSGVLVDPYTRATIQFRAGAFTSTAVQIDHVVALGNAWQSGAQQLSQESRVNFANDPLNLLAVDGPTNQEKGDANAAEWLPPSKAYRCYYVARQIAVKAKYHLSVTSPENDAMRRVLATCPGQNVPMEGQRPPVVTPAPISTALPASPTTTGPAPSGSCEPGYSPCLPVTGDLDCSDVRAMGLAPVRVTGSDRYRLDRDGDGYGCE
jgi:hypothetical protein